MNFSYELSYDNFLEYQLYTSSKSKLHQRKRFKTRIVIPIIYIAFGLYSSLKNNNHIVGLIFTVISLLWFVFYPIYSRWRYKNYLIKYVHENYNNRVNILVDVLLNNDMIFAKELSSESKIKISEIKEIIETQKNYFLKLITDVALIIPKDAINDKTLFVEKITNHGATYSNELDWQWK